MEPSPEHASEAGPDAKELAARLSGLVGVRVNAARVMLVVLVRPRLREPQPAEEPPRAVEARPCAGATVGVAGKGRADQSGGWHELVRGEKGQLRDADVDDLRHRESVARAGQGFGRGGCGLGSGAWREGGTRVRTGRAQE